MRIALDTNALYTTRAGVARYVRGLLTGLKELNPADIIIDELAWPVENFSYAQPQRMLKTVWRELVWARWTARKRLRNTNADLLHSTALSLVSAPPVREVVTLHDLALLRHPQRFRKWQRRSGLKRLQHVAKADHVIAVSRFTADEAMALLEIPARQITVVHHGVNLAKTERVPADLLPEFYLFVGSLEPGKNLDLLRQVWIAAKARGDSLPPLIVVGARWAGVRSLSIWPKRVAISLLKACFAALTPSAWTPMCSMACRQPRATCGCALIRPRKSVFTAACRTPLRGDRSSCRYRWRWSVAATVGWLCRTTPICCDGCPKVST